MRGPVVFLSDFGLDDAFVGTCHVVMAGMAPEVRVIDLTHAIPPGDVLRGALTLAEAAPFTPDGSVLLAVVDPGVGTERRPLVVEAGDRLLVGPDNGLLSAAWERLGGVTRAFEISDESLMLTPVSATFHGRDVFAPVAVRLAAGLRADDVGPAVEPGSLESVPVPRAAASRGHVRSAVIAVDRFGNAQLSATPGDLEAAGLGDVVDLEIRSPGGRTRARRARTYGLAAEGSVVLVVDSSGRLAVSVSRGSAARELGLRFGDPVELFGPAAPGRAERRGRR